VVGAIGDNLRMDYTAVGDTTNTAARMLQQAEPGQIVLAEATERLVAPYFELQALGTFTVKNRTQPVAAWALVRARPETSRLAARAARGLSPLVGRDDALATLDRAWAATRAGRGQVVFVVGDAGIGKSRLLLEFRTRLGHAVTWIQADCVSFGRSVPFLPVVGMLKHNFGIEDHHDEAAIIARVRRGLEFLGGDAAQVEPYLRYLLSVDPGDPAVATMDPAQRRARIVAAVQRLTAAGSARRPVALVVEDAHWIDSASEDLLKTLADAVPGMAVLLVVTSRPTDERPFGDRAYHWRIPLQPLDEDDAVRVVRATLDVAELPRALAAHIAARAEGNPFFLEEIGHALVETGAIQTDGGRLTLTRDAATITVPATVQDVIAARLDRLEEAQKRTVQTAAVIGREFALSLLRRVSEAQERLEQSLTELKRIELIYEKAGFGDQEYVFRHALTQDVAYATLLVSERRRLHGLIGQAIEEVHAGRLEERTEELVYHFTRAEDWPRVLRYAREAAERAAALCADDKAVEFYEAALEALRHLPETPETARAGVDVRLALRVPLWRGGEPERLFALFKEAEALAQRHGFVEALDTINTFLLQYHWSKGEQETALAYGRACLERAESRDDLGLRVTALFYMAHAYLAQGRYADGLDVARDVIARLEGPRARERFGLSGLPYSGACEQAAECLLELGDIPGALAMLDRGQRVADAANHLYSQTVLAQMRGHTLAVSGRAAEGIPILEATVATCRERRFIGQHINALRHLGAAYVLVGRPEDAITAVRESIGLQERAGVRVVRSSQHATLVAAYLALGDLERADAELGRAAALAEELGEQGCGAWIKLVEAELAAARGDRRAAEAALDEAQETAEALGMMTLLERCRTRLRAL
jgi:tetratricopeptide (TPR) repeat protein